MKIDKDIVDINNDPKTIEQGIDINKLVTWNKYIPIRPFSNQLLFLRSQELEVLYGGGARGGKGMLLSERIVTPFGMRLVGELKEGDVISTPFGTNTRILRIFDRGKQPVYKFTFQDGRIVICDLDHIWKIKISRDNYRKSNRNNTDDDSYILWDTKKILEWLENEKINPPKRKRNLLIPLTKPIQFTKSYKTDMRPIEPYLLGVLLGDGCISGNHTPTIAGIDDGIFEEIRKMGYNTSINESGISLPYEPELKESLIKLKLMGTYSYNKFIPQSYKLSSIDERKELMQGLMDTDGYVDDRGHLSYTTTSLQLAKDVQWIIWSLGGRANITEREPQYTYKGELKDGRLAYNVWIQLENGEDICRLKRKKDRRSGKEYCGGNFTPCLRLDSVEYIGEEETRCIMVEHPSGLFLIEDFIVTHNTVSMLAAALQYVHIPNYRAVIIRKTYADLSRGDGVIPLSKEWLMPFHGKGVKWNDQLKQWEFSNGSKLLFGYIDTENDIYQFQGQSYQFIGFDELTQHQEDRYRFLFSRLVRTEEQKKAGIPLRMRATTNPGGLGSVWVHDRFINKKTKPAIRAEIIEQLSIELDKDPKDIPESEIALRMPRFIPSKVKDNPYIDQRSYLANLSKLDPVTRAQLRDGDWDIRSPGNMFQRAWFEIVPTSKVPSDLKCGRYWDLAATIKKKSDFTSTCKLGYDKANRTFYILDVQLIKGTPHEIESKFRSCAKEDGPRCMIFMEEEPGSGGKNTIDNYKRKVVTPGYMFFGDRVTGTKEERARPFSAAVGNGMVKIVNYPYIKVWYDDMMNQLEAFPEGEHDDGVDAMSGCFNCLAKKMATSAVYIGKIEDTMNLTQETGVEPQYLKKEKGRNIIDMMSSGKLFGDSYRK